MRVSYHIGGVLLACVLLLVGCFAVTLDRDLSLTPEMLAPSSFMAS